MTVADSSAFTPAVTPADTPPATAVPLEPELADIARRWKACGIPDLFDGCLDPHGGPVSRERARNVRAFFYPKPDLPKGRIELAHIDGAAHGGDAQVPVKLVWPHAGAAIGTLVYLHGGGFIVGDLDSHEAHALRLANEAQCTVVLVDYRLAPEHRFPAAYLDALAATRWAREHIARLSGAGTPLAIGGDSAGGNLAAAVALTCRDTGLALAAQLLLYPATDLPRHDSTPEHAYLGRENVQTLGRDPRVSPRHAASHAGLAPVILGVGPHDFLYADNMAYAQVLREAGVALTLRIFPDLNHGFFSHTAVSKSSLAAAQRMCADLKVHLERAAA